MRNAEPDVRISTRTPNAMQKWATRIEVLDRRNLIRGAQNVEHDMRTWIGKTRKVEFDAMYGIQHAGPGIDMGKLTHNGHDTPMGDIGPLIDEVGASIENAAPTKDIGASTCGKDASTSIFGAQFTSNFNVGGSTDLFIHQMSMAIRSTHPLLASVCQSIIKMFRSAISMSRLAISMSRLTTDAFTEHMGTSTIAVDASNSNIRLTL